MRRRGTLVKRAVIIGLSIAAVVVYTMKGDARQTMCRFAAATLNAAVRF
jgi:hypothetical protein